MTDRVSVSIAAGLARALDGVKGELLKLSAIATSNGLPEDGNKIGDLAVNVSEVSLALDAKARKHCAVK